MSCLRSSVVFCVLFFIASGAQGQLDASMVRKVDSIFSPWDKTNGPGCALAIVKDGKIIYERGYGLSNLEYSIAITPKSLFHVASISKQFTAAAIQMLALQGKLSLNDDIRKYIPEMPNFGEVITIKHLIHHTSGLRDQWDLQGLAGWRDDDVITEDDIMDMVKRQQALNFKPGDDYSYCNTGFTLLGVIVKRVTGVSLRDYADSVFFKPLGMTSTVFHSNHSEIVPNRTSAYYAAGDGRWVISIPVFDNYGATSLFTTVEDLAKWDENFYTHQVGGEAFIRAMLEPGVLNNGEQQTYASGLGLGEYHGNAFVEHSGADAGYRADFLRFPGKHFSVIVLANLGNMNPSRLCRRVADLFLPPVTGEVLPGGSGGVLPTPNGGVKTAVALDTLAARGWVGRYFDEVSKAEVKITFEPAKGSNNATLKRDGGVLLPLTDSSFMDPNGAKYVFGGAGALMIHMAGMLDRRLVKVSLSRPSAAEMAVYGGEYYSQELAVDVTVSARDSVLMIKLPRSEAQELSPDGRDRFDGPFIVEFVRDRRNRVTAFRLSTGRSRNLLFTAVASR